MLHAISVRSTVTPRPLRASPPHARGRSLHDSGRSRSDRPRGNPGAGGRSRHDRSCDRQRLPRPHRGAGEPVGRHRRLSASLDAFRADNPEHGLRRGGRHHRRLDVPVLHPAGHADDRRPQRGGPRRQRGRQPRVRPGLRRPLRSCAEPRPTGSTSAPTSITRTRPTPRSAEYWTAKFEGVTIGFVGAVTEELPSLVSPAGIEDISVGSPVDAANRVADQLTDGKKPTARQTSSSCSCTRAGRRHDPRVRNRPEQSVRRDRAERERQHRRDRLGPHPPAVQPRDRRSPRHRGAASTASGSATWRSATTAPRDTITKMENTLYTMATAFDAAGNVTARPFEPDPRDRSDVTAATRSPRTRHPGDRRRTRLQPGAAARRRERPARCREPRRGVDTRQLRRRCAALVAERGRPGPRRADHVHEPRRPPRRHRCRCSTYVIARRRTCSRSRTRS